MGYSHFLRKNEVTELHRAPASICIEVEAVRVIW